MQKKNDPKRLIGEVQIFRIRVGTAESQLKVLREQSRQAKRRRQEAKRLAERARKGYKRFKADVADLKQSLAKAEAKLFQAGGRALARKLARAKSVAKRRARSSKKSKAIARKPRPTMPRLSRVPGRIARKRPAAPDARFLAPVPDSLAALASTPVDPANRRTEFLNL